MCTIVRVYGPCARLHAQSASICRRVRQGLPTYSVVVQIISSATYSVAVHIHIVSAASSKDICLELSITESGPRARISSDEKTVVMPVAKVPVCGNPHCIKSAYNQVIRAAIKDICPQLSLVSPCLLEHLAKSKDKICYHSCSTLNLCHKEVMSGNTQCQE